MEILTGTQRSALKLYYKLPPYHQGRDELSPLHAPLRESSLVSRAAR